MSKNFIALLFAVCLLVSPASAAILLDDWAINLEPVLGAGAGTVTGIDEIGFTGLVHQQVDGVLAPGTKTFVDGLFDTTTFKGDAGNFLTSTGTGILGINYELTGSFSLGSVITGVTATEVDFTHLGGSQVSSAGTYDGVLDLYLDASNDANTSPVAGGAGFENGTKVASFIVKSGDGGGFDSATFDGSDDATFELTFALPGVLFDGNGVDLSTLPAGVTIGLSDSNFDLDPDGNDIIDTDPSGWPGAVAGEGFHFDGAGSIISSFGTEDGSFVLATVPEPATIVVWGVLATVGGLVSHRRRNRA